MDQVVVVGQDERAALLDLQAVLVARYLLPTRLLGGGEKLSAQPGLIGHLGRREGRVAWRRRSHDGMSVHSTGKSCPVSVPTHLSSNKDREVKAALGALDGRISFISTFVRVEIDERETIIFQSKTF